MQTRDGNWHDFFQFLSWLLFPRTKAVINALHVPQAQARTLRCITFGHAVYEKALHPYVGMTANAILLGNFFAPSLALPVSALKSSGELVLYSLADGEIVDVSKPISLQTENRSTP